jgi:hypothetical protein
MSSATKTIPACALLALAGLAIVTAGIHAATASGSTPSGAAGEIVAVVNGEPILRADFSRSLVRTLGPAAVETFVDWMLVEQEARRRGVSVTDAELAARKELEVALRMRALAENVRVGPDEYRLTLEGRGTDMASVRAAVEAGVSDNALRVVLLAEKMLAPRLDLSEKALHAYYERTRGQRCMAAHVVLRGKRQAQELLNALEQRPALWSRAVLDYSLDRESVPHEGKIVPVPVTCELGKALAVMQPGEMKLYEEGDLWHVLRLIKQIPAAPEGFDEAKDRLRAELIAVGTAGRFEELLATLNKDACVVDNLLGDPPTRRALGEDVGAFVNGEALTMARLGELLTEEFGVSTLSPYIERTLVLQEARRRGLSVPDQEYATRARSLGEGLFQEEARRRDVSPEAWTDLLSARGLDVARHKSDLVEQLIPREDVRASILAEKMAAEGLQVSEADLAEAYEELRKDRFVVRELDADSLKAAERIYGELSRGVSFEAIARTEVSGPGVWQPGGFASIVTSSHPYYAYVKDLKAGELSGIFKSGRQYRIIEVIERLTPTEPPPLETVRSSLEQEVRLRKSRARIRAFLLKLKAESEIEVRLD